MQTQVDRQNKALADTKKQYQMLNDQNGIQTKQFDMLKASYKQMKGDLDRYLADNGLTLSAIERYQIQSESASKLKVR